jgi:hypothetical protein
VVEVPVAFGFRKSEILSFIKHANATSFKLVAGRGICLHNRARFQTKLLLMSCKKMPDSDFFSVETESSGHLQHPFKNLR